jgi:hypothetical protein
VKRGVEPQAYNRRYRMEMGYDARNQALAHQPGR